MKVGGSYLYLASMAAYFMTYRASQKEMIDECYNPTAYDPYPNRSAMANDFVTNGKNLKQQNDRDYWASGMSAKLCNMWINSRNNEISAYKHGTIVG